MIQGVFQSFIIPAMLVSALGISALPACKKTPPAPPPAPQSPPTVPSFPREAPPERVEEKTPEAILGTLRHAALEMALDGFQFDKAELGWPFDCKAATVSAYLGLLADKGYLAPQDLGHFRGVEISNLSDSDPGETAFAKITLRNQIHLIRKDGRIATTEDQRNLSPTPPREPAWLPQ